MDPQITSWSNSLMASLSTALALLFAAVPKVLGFLIILGIGWLIASLIEKLLVAVLRALHVDGFAARAGLGGMVRAIGREPSSMLGVITKWFVRLIVLVAAFDALGVPAVAQVFNQLLLWVPNLAVALVVLVIGGIAANALADASIAPPRARAWTTRRYLPSPRAGRSGPSPSWSQSTRSASPAPWSTSCSWRWSARSRWRSACPSASAHAIRRGPSCGRPTNASAATWPPRPAPHSGPPTRRPCPTPASSTGARRETAATTAERGA